MSQQDANFQSQIFRKDNPIILAMRRDKAQFIGARIAFDGDDYIIGQALVRKPSDGLFYRWSAASGGSYDTPCVLYDNCLGFDFSEDGAPSATGAQGAPLVRGLISGTVYTNKLVGSDANFLTALKAVNVVDAGGVAMTKF